MVSFVSTTLLISSLIALTLLTSAEPQNGYSAPSPSYGASSSADINPYAPSGVSESAAKAAKGGKSPAPTTAPHPTKVPTTPIAVPSFARFSNRLSRPNPVVAAKFVSLQYPAAPVAAPAVPAPSAPLVQNSYETFVSPAIFEQYTVETAPPTPTHSASQKLVMSPPAAPAPVSTTTEADFQTTGFHVTSPKPNEPESEQINQATVGQQQQVPVNVPDNGVYYVLLPDGRLQKVSYATAPLVQKSGKLISDANEVAENTGYLANIKYQNIEPINGPVYAYNAVPLVRIYK